MRSNLGTRGIIVWGAIGLAAGMGVLSFDGGADAADHLDPSPRVGNPAGNPADIADLYAWHTDTLANGGNLVLALTFAGPVASTELAADRDVLYGIHLDSADAGLTADVDIWIRFGQDSEGNWGVRVDNIPGATGPVIGRVGSVIDLGGALVYAGVRDDPFFFDLQGFRDTLMTGDVAFNSTRDFFAGLNVSAVVIELPLRALPGTGPYELWATTGRI